MSEKTLVNISNRESEVWAKALILAREVVSQVSLNIAPHFRVKPEEQPRIFEFASLIRATRLLEGMITLYEQGNHDVAECLMRPVIECLLVGTFLSLKPQEGWEMLTNDAGLQHERMGKAGLTGFAELANEMPWGRKAINWRDLSERVAVLRQGTEEDATKPKSVYDELYRRASYSDVHTGYGALIGYVVTQPRGRVVKERHDGIAPLPLLLTSFLVTDLAVTVSKDIGLRTDLLEPLFDKVVTVSQLMVPE